MICLGIHSNVMLRFMVQAFQDPPLCSGTSTWPSPGVNTCSWYGAESAGLESLATPPRAWA
jgi:hypothetical protein